MNNTIKQQLKDIFEINNEKEEVIDEAIKNFSDFKIKIKKYINQNSKIKGKKEKAVAMLLINTLMKKSDIEVLVDTIIYILLKNKQESTSVQNLFFSINTYLVSLKEKELKLSKNSIIEAEIPQEEQCSEETCVIIEKLHNILYNIDIIVNRQDKKVISIKSLLFLPERLKRAKQVNYFAPPTFNKQIEWTNSSIKHSGVFRQFKKEIFKDTSNKDYKFLNLLQSVPFSLDKDLIKREVKEYKLKKAIIGFMDYQLWNKTINKYKEDSKFYFKWHFDKRGRSYCEGYQLNIQGTKENRALLNLGNKVKLTLSDEKAIIIDIMGNLGYSDTSFNKRIDTFYKDIKDNLNNKKFIKDLTCSTDTECGIKARKGISLYLDLLANKEVTTGYTMELDATTSGLQIMGVLAGCKKTCELTNVVQKENNEDSLSKAYIIIKDIVNKELPENHRISSGKVDNKIWSANKKVKKALMTHFFNSEVVPNKVFTKKQLDTFYKVLDINLEGASYIKDTINDAFKDGTTETKWKLDDYHDIYYPNIEYKEFECFLNVNDEKIYFDYKYKTINKTDNYRSLAPNIIHSIDSLICKNLIKNCALQGAEVVHIHDCFVFSPKHYELVKHAYKKELALLLNNNILERILTSISGKKYKIESFKEISFDSVMNGIHAIS